MQQLAFPVQTLEAPLLAHLYATAYRAFPEVGRYQIAFAEMEPLACCISFPVPTMFFHSIFDHPDTPLFVFETTLLHELCHQVQTLQGIRGNHDAPFLNLLKSRLSLEMLLRSSAWIDLQLGRCLEESPSGSIRVRKNWRRHFLRPRDSLFDWMDREHREWSIQESRVFQSHAPVRLS